MKSGMTPYLSVIVPTYNRPEALSKCLRALLVQDYPSNRFEVVVVNDGGSLPPSCDLPQSNVALKVTSIEKSGVSAARNFGAQIAGGDLLVFTDDDCLPSPGWLSALAVAHTESPSAVLGGTTNNQCEANPQAEFAQCVVDTSSELGPPNTSAGTGNPRFFPSCNIAVPKAAYLGLGGFDEGFDVHAAEDRNFCARCQLAGYPMRRVENASMAHAHSMTVLELAALYFRHARGAVQSSRLLGDPVAGDVGSRLALRRALRKKLVWSDLPNSCLNRLNGTALYLLWESVSIFGFCYEVLRQRIAPGLRSQLISEPSRHAQR